MPPTPPAPASGVRRRRTRTTTKNVSSRPALKLSTLRPDEVELRQHCECLVCPDCHTWVPITGIAAKVTKLVPHHREEFGTTGTAHRCQGSNRRVDLDIDRCIPKIAAWPQKLIEAQTDAAARRRTTPTPKPKVKLVPTPVSRMAPQSAVALTRHRDRCRECVGRHLCEDGLRLATAYGQTLRQQQELTRKKNARTTRRPAAGPAASRH